MIHHYNLSEPLKRALISRRGYSLLDRAVIRPENLIHFYRTYRLPKDPFFPLFLLIKRDYYLEKERKAAEKDKHILEEMKKLSPERLRDFRFMAEWEDSLNRTSEHPVWEKSLWPHTKKRVKELQSLGDWDWLLLMNDHLEHLAHRYSGIKPGDRKKTASCLALRLQPSLPRLDIPSRNEIIRAYRRLSRLYHPDSGGTDTQFISLGEHRDYLLSLQ